MGGVSGVQTLDPAQRAVVRELLGYVSSVTGIQFVEASGVFSSNAIHFVRGDISGDTLGRTEFNGGTSFDIAVDTITYPENADFGAAFVRMILLHELGHVLGLDHPNLPPDEDDTEFTVMSYSDNWGYPTTFRPYDLLALSWIYGGDGIGGTWGYNSTPRPKAAATPSPSHAPVTPQWPPPSPGR